MGICVSTPNVKFSEKALETKNEQRLSDSGQRGGSLDKAIAPVRVFRDEEEMGIALRPTKSGAIIFDVAKHTLDEAAEAAEELQASLQDEGAGTKELENLRLLESMGLEVRYSSSTPFIGKLSLKFLELTNTKHAQHTYVKVRCEGDRSSPVYATAEKDGEEDAAVFTGSPQAIFIVLHSNAHVMMKVRDRQEGGFFGSVTVGVTDIEQGSHVRSFELRDPKDANRIMATLKVEVTYEYLRGTKDDGSYLGPSRVLINKRRMREGAGPFGAFNFISQVNHWLLSHDNIWNPMPAPDKEQKRSKEIDSDDDEYWPGHHVERTTSSMLQTRRGNSYGQSKGAKYRRALHSAKHSDVNKATDTMAESSLLEALAPEDGDGWDVQRLKGELQALLLAMHDRMQSMETVQEQQNAAIQDLMKGLAASTGQSDDTVEEPFISGTFEYGGRAAAQRKVYLFANKAQDQGSLTDATVQFLGVFKTDKKGKLEGVPVPPRIAQQPGHYSVVGLLPEDHTFSKGMLFLLEPGTKCVIFDVDGTLTVGDIQVVTVAALDGLAVGTSIAENLSHKYDLKARPHALHVVRAWAAKGYQPIYLSGRQGSYFNLTLEWLVKHAYPPGPIHLTRTHLPTLPLYYSVGNFKVAYMEMLKAKGLELYAAYGNTTTDIRAYAAAGIPKENTFVVGPHGGKMDSVKVDSFTEHLSDVFKHPDSDVPIPYTELLITATPGYKPRDPGERSARRSGLLGRLSRASVATAASDAVEDVDATLQVSDKDDVEEDEGADDEDADSDEEALSAATGAAARVAAGNAGEDGQKLNQAMRQAHNGKEAATAVFNSGP
ncbi:hypothetical protein CVIRNUC_000518 [Coccomyxa viridis]|uniref:LNS2/PITP domain-containing protein n=1 Tax=Coccomyxa viridis TaxID=1274662 RepID=A0AAV1HRL9_9CHLO|nr:hypothetical protein CVIRNUC_000518 [Coccomyxa viridis]